MLELVRNRVISISNNNLQEQKHLLDTEQKLILICPDASDILRIAALGHDIDRSLENKRIRYEDYTNYRDYKQAHALQSACIMRDMIIMKFNNIILSERVYDLIKDHEWGDVNDYEKQLLMTADSLSFFDCNLNYYKDNHSYEDTCKKILFMYDRMIGIGKEYMQNKMSVIYEYYVKKFL